VVPPELDFCLISMLAFVRSHPSSYFGGGCFDTFRQFKILREGRDIRGGSLRLIEPSSFVFPALPEVLERDRGSFHLSTHRLYFLLDLN
jgi:hypothetical protein